jgi:superfamily I DNA/RNA helicase
MSIPSRRDRHFFGPQPSALSALDSGVPITPTPQQRKAIEAPLGAALVVAGPGAGKTFCLIARIGHLVTKLGVPAGRICAVTFTNKAAEEIAARLGSALGPKVSEVRRGTIHALCADILREFAAPAGLKPGFGIADEEYQRTLLRQMRHGPRTGQLLKSFGRHRLQGHELTPGDAQVFREYRRALRRRNIVDFDDLVVLTDELFRTHEAVAEAVAGRWDYVLVDEFQDVNPAQYAILRRLAQPHGNIFAVGDDEQSIFSWAGADPRVLSRFQRDYGVAAPVVLDRNHRTSHQIFGVARRLLRENPSLFQKELTAPRLSPFEVEAFAFKDDEAEAAWIMADIQADRAAHRADDTGRALDWGDYAVLYRRHEIGNRLETAFLKAGLPCRLAKGRPLSEDPVIGYVIAALRLVQDPRDASAAESFAKRVLPPHLAERIEALIGSAEDDYLLAVRDLAGGMQGDPDAKKLWRLVYQAENLAAMGAKHDTLRSLVEELLAQRVGTYSNRLEERHEDLSDPADLPAAQALADRLAAARTHRSRIVLEPMGGLEIALRGLLFGAGFKLSLYADEVVQAELDDVRLGLSDAGPEGLAFTLFKALQLVHARGLGGAPARYVTFDLETTDVDTSTCEIVEIAAVRVEDGRVSDEFHSLVRPAVPIAPGAQRQHGYADADVALAPSFAEVWPRFRAFAGRDTLVAHNGQDFDVPVLRRMAAGIGAADAIQAYDTLPLARLLGGGSAKLSALAERFGVTPGRAHHALDDARMLVGVYEALEQRRVVRARKSSLVNLLPYLGLAFALDDGRRKTDEVTLLFGQLAAAAALGRFSDCLEYYDAERARRGAHGPSLEEIIERLGGRGKMDRLRQERDAASRYPEAVARLEALIEQAPGETLALAMQRFLERVTLSASREVDVERHRVNLLTLHSTKGLEFSRVYVVGVEDEQMPGWIPKGEDPEHAIQESRRLLYVGMTRAIERLMLTRVDRRAGKPGGGSRFLGEMGLGAGPPPGAPEA